MSVAPQKIRCFFAVEIPDGLKGYIKGEVIAPLAKLPVSVKWVEPKNLHLTLKFLGEILPTQMLAAAATAEKLLTSTGKAKLYLTEAGTFGGKTPSVIWVGIGGDVSRLEVMSGVLTEICKTEKIDADDKKFSPHITIGRPKTSINSSQLLSAIKSQKLQNTPFEVAELVLFRSTLTPSGPIYEAVKRILL